MEFGARILIFDFNSKFDFGRLSHITSSPVFSIWKPWRYKTTKIDPCEVNTGNLIAETAVIQCIVLFSDILILFLAYQEIISPVF